MTAPTWDPGYREGRERDSGQPGYEAEASFPQTGSGYPQRGSGSGRHADPAQEPASEYERDTPRLGPNPPVWNPPGQTSYGAYGSPPASPPTSSQPAWGPPRSAQPAREPRPESGAPTSAGSGAPTSAGSGWGSAASAHAARNSTPSWESRPSSAQPEREAPAWGSPASARAAAAEPTTSPAWGPVSGSSRPAWTAPSSGQPIPTSPPVWSPPGSAQPSNGHRRSSVDQPTAYIDSPYRSGAAGPVTETGFRRPSYDTGAQTRVIPLPGERAEPVARTYGGGGGAGGKDDSGGKGFRKAMPLWQELPLLLIVAFCLAVLIRTFLLQAFFIPSGSMENTLLIGDRVLVNKVVYDLRDPLRGEVVVFRGPDNWVPETQTTTTSSNFVARLGRTVGDLVGVSSPGEKDFIKRVIGLPGDTVQCCDAQGRVTVNGVPLNEPYVTENSPLDIAPTPGECRSRKFAAVKVQPGMLWVMGDHRLVSQDSRCQGQVPIANVIGRAFIVVWPSKSWADLPVPSTFATVPQAAAGAREGPVSPDLTPITPANSQPGTVALVLPLLLSSVYLPPRGSGRFPARSRPGRWRRRRRLAA